MRGVLGSGVLLGHGHRNVSAAEPGWVDIERLAQVEITSEDVNYPIEAALNPGTGLGWRAAQPGEQMASGSAIVYLDKKSLGMEGAKKMRGEVFSCGDSDPDIATPKV